ncbi:hypothetical protein SAMN05192583_0561 [Sphingomonas gellani]|uniref:Uncharacterized protein n=1 Tax=Sphingomonas gellani TaxID=1166340 RepID=A0A1H7Z6M3_9SPHN|nr:hypothetical protein SAMN05192583_0561 [Sphingomonas gellani]
MTAAGHHVVKQQDAPAKARAAAQVRQDHVPPSFADTLMRSWLGLIEVENRRGN